MAKRAPRITHDTRATTNLGISAKVFCTRTRKKLFKVRDQVAALVCDWDDVASGFGAELEDVVRQVDHLIQKTLPDYEEYLNEPASEGWGE